MSKSLLVMVVGVLAASLHGQTTLQNGDFESGLTGWTPWAVRDDGGDLSRSTIGGILSITGSDFEAGVYQQFDTGGAGRIVNVIGFWQSQPTLSNGMYAEIWVINDTRLPVEGADEVDGLNNAILLFRNDTFGGRGAWADAVAKSSPVKHRISFTAAADKATLILKTGNNNPGGLTGAAFDNISIHALSPAATPASLPPGFSLRTAVFPVSSMVSIAQSPTSRGIYAIRNNQEGGSTLLYRIDTDGPSLAAIQVSDLSQTSVINPGFSEAQGLAFDAAGNIYVSNRLGRIIKGVDSNPDPAIDAFVFSQMFDLPDPQIGTFHGVGGVAVGPDGYLYINSGSETHYGPEDDKGYNMRILRAPLTATTVAEVETFCEGIRNSFDISFRIDGKLFGVENGPNLNCDYAEEFNLLESGFHYGFPYRFGSDISGSDNSIACSNDPPRVGPQPLPVGLDPRPAWANYGPDAKPDLGQRGYANGGAYYGFDGHSSPNGLDFYEPSLMDPAAIKLPAEYHGRAFVARFGQLENFSLAVNPNPANVGFDVLSLRLDDAHEGFISNRFLTGIGRPMDVLCAYNGRVYVLEFNQQSSFPGGGWGTPSRLYELSYTIPTSPIISLSATQISRTTDYTEVPVADTFEVSNGGVGTLAFSLSIEFADPGEVSWLQISPQDGSSTGPGDPRTITATYLPAVSALPIGLHTATIIVSDPEAQNSPETVTVLLTVRTVIPDADNDGDVDQYDFGRLQACYTQSGVPPTVGCEFADFNKDSTVNALDLGILRSCLSGAGVIANKACDDAYE